MPFTDIEIIDDWHVLGLAGTGSRSLRLRDVFVPEHRCVLLSELLAGTPPGAEVHADYPLVRAPRGLMVNYSLPPVAIALGNRALAVALASLRERVSRGITRMAASEFVQMTSRGSRRGDRCRHADNAQRTRRGRGTGREGRADPAGISSCARGAT